MDLIRCDVFVGGGGLAGLTAAAAFSQAGFTVVLADSAPPPAVGAAEEDRRSTAFLQPARTLLETAGLWDDLAPHAVPLSGLRIVDTEGWPPVQRETRSFAPQDLGADSFGWNLPNARTRRLMARRLAGRAGLRLIWGAGVRGLVTRTGEARVTLSDEQRVAARLVIAADGRESPLRDLAGIGARTWRYGQRAFAFTATHEIPHGSVSTEVYNRGGAFTTVPLPDLDGRPASAIVWMNAGPRARALAEMSPDDFDGEMTARACGLLGRIHRAGPLGEWPVITRTAARLSGERLALVAEAAHVMPPIGAQGLNTSLRDVAALHALAVAAPEALGSREQLDIWARGRERDIAVRARIIDLYNRICQSGDAPVQALRRAGLRLVHDAPSLRHRVMQAGLGPR